MKRALLSISLLSFVLAGCIDREHGTCAAPDDNVQWFWIYENGGPLLGVSDKCIYCDNLVPPSQWSDWSRDNGFFYGSTPPANSPSNATPCLYSGTGDEVQTAEQCQAAMCSGDPPTHDPVRTGHGAWSYIEPRLNGAAAGAGLSAFTPSEVPEEAPEEEEEAEQQDDGCSPVAELACGETVSADTAAPDSGATRNVDNYEGVVGSFRGAELAYTFAPTVSGPVSFSFVDADPMSVNHDLFLLDDELGCYGESTLQRGFNSLEFEARAGATYILVVDSYPESEGRFTARLDCEES